MKKIVSIFLAIAMVFILCACGENSQTVESTDSVSRTDITIALPNNCASFDLISTTNPSEEQVMNCIYQQLYLFPTSADEPIMEAAESYEVSDDLLTYTFKIRDELVFSNGDPLTAEDVLFSYEKLVQEFPDETFAANLDYLEAPDESTFVVHLKKVVPDFLENAATFIIPKDYYNEVGAEAFGEAPIGSGPYKFVSYTPGDTVVLTANENYYGEQPKIKDVTYKIMSSASANSISLEAGTIQFSSNISAADYEYLANVEGITTGTYTLTNIIDVIFYDLTKAPFDNADFRKAVLCATDRQMMIDTAFGGIGTPATTLCSPTSFGYDNTIEGYTYDLDRAAEYLASSGYPNGEGLEPLTIYVYADREKTMAEILQSSLKQLGVEVEIELIDSSAFIERLTTGDIPFGIIGCGTSSFHAASYETFYDGENSRMFSQYAKTANAEKVAQLFDEATRETDLVKQEAIYKSIWQITYVEDAAYDAVNYREYMYGADASLDMTRALEMVSYRGINPYFISYKET